MKDTEKAFFVCVAFCLLFSLLPTDWLGGGWDFEFHYNKTLGDTQGILRGNEMDSYPWLFHFVAGFFDYRLIIFKWFGILLLGLLIPMALFFVSKDWLSVLFYFTTTSFFYFFEQGIYAQALMMLIMLLFWVFKNPIIHIGLIYAALLTHSWGLHLALLTLACIYLHKSEWINEILKIKNKILLGCSGWFPINDANQSIRPNEFLDTHLLSSQENNFSMALRVSFLFKLIVEIFPLPFALMGFYQTYQNKRFDFLLLALASLVIGSFYDYRIFFILPLVLIPGLVDYYRNINVRLHKFGFIAMIIFFGILNFVVWFNYKTICMEWFGL